MHSRRSKLQNPSGHSEESPPLVSVVIAACNQARYIGQSVESVFSQRYDVCEVIVVDDGSTDETEDVLKPYSHRVKYIHQENQGPSAARNRGLNDSSGEFVVFLDGDDYLLPDALAERMSCLEAHPSWGAVHSGWRFVNEQEELIADEEPWRDAPRLDLKTWLLWKPVFLGSMLFRKEWLDCVGGFDPSLRQAEDVDLMLRLALAGCEFGWRKTPTVCRRQHDENLTRNGLQQAEELTRVLDKFFAQGGIPRAIRQIEKRGRYHTFIWIAWYLHRTGYHDHVPRYLQYSMDMSYHAPREIISDWIAQFARLISQDNGDVHELYSLIPAFRSAVHHDRELSAIVEKTVSWWSDVWWHYLHRDDLTAMRGLSAYRGYRVRDLVQLAQTSLIVSPRSRSIGMAHRFLSDALEGRLIARHHNYEATALYLTVFGQALLARYWHIAIQALLYAVRWGWNPSAWMAWVNFLRAAVAYATGRSHSQIRSPS